MTIHACMKVDVFKMFYLADVPIRENTWSFRGCSEQLQVKKYKDNVILEDNYGLQERRCGYRSRI